jgi:farnesyl diphosphate synthase
MSTIEIDFEADLTRTAERVDDALTAILDESAPDGRLVEAMRHGALAGGKRLRPYLVLASAGMFSVREEAAMPTACALEFLHCYSLVHDDLPAMDDDDLRRGKPTVHRAYDEATAILAGDALLTLAFEVISAPGSGADPATAPALVHALARAAGVAGMAGGQMLDLAAEGRFSADGEPLGLTEDEILGLQAMKTGALFRFAAEAGAILGKANPEDRVRLSRYGAALGRAFQIADDLLDEEASPEELGKATAKDRARGKATLPAVIGNDAARTKLAQAVSAARESLAPFGDKAKKLLAAADFAADRRK